MRILKQATVFLLAATMLCVLSACGAQAEDAAEVTRMAPSAAGSNYINGAIAEPPYDEGETTDEGAAGGELSEELRTLAANFDQAYYGPYNTEQDILLGFDETDSCGLAAILSNDGETLEWAFLGDWTQDGDSHVFEDAENPKLVNFTVESSTESSLRIHWMQEGTLNLESVDPQVIADFFAAVDTGELE